MRHIILFMYPNATLDDFVLLDLSDGKGPFIAKWNDQKLGPMPTPADIAAAKPAADAQVATEEARRNAIDTAIAGDGTLQLLKGLNNAEFDAWWTTNITNIATLNAFVKRLVRLIVRRLL